MFNADLVSVRGLPVVFGLTLAYGENLTLLGFDWAGLRHGDRLRFGAKGPLLLLTDHAPPCVANHCAWAAPVDRSGRPK